MHPFWNWLVEVKYLYHLNRTTWCIKCIQNDKIYQLKNDFFSIFQSGLLQTQ